MSKKNISRRTAPRPTTHEGGIAKNISYEQALRRSVMANMLWEGTFYEDGVDIADRISGLIPHVAPELVAAIASEARNQMKLRHVPLLIAREMARLPKHKSFVKATLANIIQRPDELGEFVNLYWAGKRQPLSGQVKKGLAEAFTKFDGYQLAKYNRDSFVKLRDVMFMVHPKPLHNGQELIWKSLAEDSLEAPDTWEVALSGGADKKETWLRLMGEQKLGAMALLRNLRNMQKAGVSRAIIGEALGRMKVGRVLPFRFISAADAAPDFEPELEVAMLRCMAEQPKLKGHTVVVVDNSGSMYGMPVSKRSKVDRAMAAQGLAMLLREYCESIDVLVFSNSTVKIPARKGFALRDKIRSATHHGGTYLGGAIDSANLIRHDRVIVITDEQAHDHVGDPMGRGYLINVAPYQHGVGYGKWHHIDGFSEATINYILEYEKAFA